MGTGYESPTVADMTVEPRVAVAAAVLAGAKAVAAVAGKAIAAGAVAGAKAAGAVAGAAVAAKAIGN